MYTKVDELIWTDIKFNDLTDDSKLLFIYVLTNPHRNMLGFYHLPLPYAAFDLKWTDQRLNKGLKELLDKGLINYNFSTNIMFIKNYLKHNPLENPNQVKGAITALNKLPANGIDSQLIAILQGFGKGFYKPLLERLQERLVKPVTVTVTETVTEDIKEEFPAVNKEEIFFKECWVLYPNKKGQVSPTQQKQLYKLGDELKRCISRYLDFVKKERDRGFNLAYKNGSTFFNNGYKDYLDEVYAKPEPTKKYPLAGQIKYIEQESVRREEPTDTEIDF